MADTRTVRMNQIAKDHDLYTSANSIRAITMQRDELVNALELMLSAYWPENEDGTFGDGGAAPSMVANAQKIVAEVRQEQRK